MVAAGPAGGNGPSGGGRCPLPPRLVDSRAVSSYRTRVAIDLRHVFRPPTVTLELKSPDKESAIADLIDVLVAAGEIPDRSAALEAVLDRERRMSTGMQHGIAIPHGKTETVAEVVAAVGIHRRGVDFQSLDGRLTHVIILALSPQGMAAPHVQFLAEVGRLLENPGLREALLKARSKEDLVSLLTAAR